MADDRRFREVQRYAGIHGFLGGFPNFHEADHGDGVVYGTVLLRASEAEWRDVPRSQYQIFHIEDVPGLFRAANDYAATQNFPAAFPNCEQADHGQGVVYGTILMNPGTVEWRDVPRAELGNPALNNVPAMMRAANDYAGRQGFPAAFPTFHQADYGAGVVYGIVLLRPGVSVWRDVPADLLAMYSAPPRRWAILLCNLRDRRPTPNSRDRYVEFFTEAGAGTESAFDYWRDISYGTDGLRDTAVLGFFQIPHSSTELQALSGTAQRQRAFDWGLDAARTGNAPLGDFEHKVVVLNGGATDHGQTSGGVLLNFEDTAPLEPSFIFHELGHEFGLDHSFSDADESCDPANDARPGAYCDRGDIMGAGLTFRDARNRPTGPSLNALSRKRLGWLHQSRIRTLPPTGPAEVLTLADVDHPEVDGYQLIQFVGASRDNPAGLSVYTVEYRQQTGWDRGLDDSYVIVHEIRSDGLIRILAKDPDGALWDGPAREDREFTSPALAFGSTVVRLDAIDTVSHTARVRCWRLPASGRRDIRILSVLFDPVGPEPQGEFVLIQNDRAASADLTGWTLQDAGAHIYRFGAFALVPGGTVKVWTGIGTDDSESRFWGRRQAVWNNTGDIAILRDAAGNEVSRFAYTA